MRLSVAPDVEDFRFVEMARIERRRRQADQHLALRGNMNARDGHVGPRIAHDAVPPRARRVHAQDFLHRLVHQGWIADQAFALLRVAEHGQQAEFDLRDGALVPGHQHARRQAHRLFLGRLAQVDRRKQIRQQVVARILALVPHLAANVGAQLFPGQARRGARAAFMLVRHHLVGQLGEKGVILVEHTHQRADDHSRKRKGEVAPQVSGLGLGRQRLEQLRGDRLYPLREQLHPVVAERRRHDRA